MRRLGRNRAHSDEEESVFVTMTDMTISFLLIIMILLAFFATQLNDDETVPLNTYERVLQERDSLKVKNKELSSALAAVEIELARVQDELVSVTAERNQLRNEIVQLKSALEALEAVLARIKAELASITAERDQLLEDIKRLRSENEALSDELAHLGGGFRVPRGAFPEVGVEGGGRGQHGAAVGGNHLSVNVARRAVDAKAHRTKGAHVRPCAARATKAR